MGDEVFAVLQGLKIPEYAEAFAARQWTMGALKARLHRTPGPLAPPLPSLPVCMYPHIIRRSVVPSRIPLTARGSPLRARAGSAARPVEAGPGWCGA
eukprot:COSAG02_NODE_12934_length_1470_cov_1.657914_1_plen_97_part_00